MKINPRVALVRQTISTVVSMLAGKRIKVTQRGIMAYVDYDPVTLQPVKINLPQIPDDASDQLLAATQGFLDHEVAHVLFTEAAVVGEAKALGLAKAHNIIEDTYIERMMKRRFAGSSANIGQCTEFCYEKYQGPRLAEAVAAGNQDEIESVLFNPIMRAWSGEAESVDFMRDKWSLVEALTERLGEEVKERVAKLESSRECLELTIEVKKRLQKPPPPPAPEPEEQEEQDDAPKNGAQDKDQDRENDDTPPEQSDKPEPSDNSGEKGEKENEDDEAGESSDANQEGEEGNEEDNSDDATSQGESDDESEGQDDENDASSGKSDDDANNEDGNVQDANEKDQSGEDDRSADEADSGMNDSTGDDGEKQDQQDGDAGDTSDTPTGAEADAEEQEGEAEDMYARLEKGEAFDGMEDIAAQLITQAAKEANESTDYKVFTRDFDKIEKFEPEGDVSHIVAAMGDEVDHMAGVMQKHMERIMQARSQAVYVGGKSKGRLHGASLAKLHFGNDKVFASKEINKTKDVAVEILVDISGSMAMQSSKIKTAAKVAWALSSVLTRMNIAHEIIGYTTDDMPYELKQQLRKEQKEQGNQHYARHDIVYMPIFKSFEEKFATPVKSRLAALSSMGCRMRENLDGESLQIAAQRLRSRRETRKILMVLNDGMPNCYGTTDDFTGNNNSQTDHLKAVVKSIESSRDIDLMAIGIMTDAPKKFYTNATIVNKIEELPGKCMGEMQKLLFA